MTTACKRCLLSEIDERDVVAAVRRAIDAIPPNHKTAPPEYRRRLALCLDCDHLLSGTCMRCGCYVELRAAQAAARCPDKQKRW